MILSGARVAVDAVCARRADVSLQGGRLSFDVSSHAGPVLDLTGYLLLPGLINAHDHLEFNLFPRLGSGPYANAKNWAQDIYRPSEDPVRTHSGVPKPVRLFWGGIKNLLSGVTTVAHHNPYEPAFDDYFPVRVVKRFGWAHSLDFASDLPAHFRATPAHWPFVLHAAEGVDEAAGLEIGRLDEMGILTSRTVLVHGVAIDEAGFQLLAERRTSLIWCPTSNETLFGRSLDPAAFRSGIDIAIGTDSAISAQTNLAQEIKTAQTAAGLSPEELYDMVTACPRRMLRLTSGEGALEEGGAADVVVVRDYGQSPAEAVLDLQPEMVLVGGRIRLVGRTLQEAVEQVCGLPLYSFRVEDRDWFSDLDLPHIYDATSAALGEAPLLAGRRVSV